MIVNSIFPTAIGIERDFFINDKEKLINEINWKTDKSLQGNFYQSETNLQLKKNWKLIFDNFIMFANIFVENLGFKTNNLFVTQAWLNYMPKNSFIDWHYHSNSFISGIYYMKSTCNEGTLFQNVNNPLNFFIQTEIAKDTEYNANVYKVNGVENTLILFPSYITHCSEIASDDRYTIAFNIMPKVLGKENHFNYLKIK